jgi:Ca2+-binding EF-hand superfamily protein
MDVNDFIRGMSQIGLNLSDSDARQEFAKIDENGGGQVLFVEFCAYIRRRVNPDHDPNFDADIVSGEHCGKVLRHHGSKKRGHHHNKHHQHATRDLQFGGGGSQFGGGGSATRDLQFDDEQSNSITASHFVNKKSFKDFDDLEKIIKETISDRMKILKLWKRLDFNGNNIVSLAEIDKLAVEKFPLLNHKPALMRAYKMTISKKGGGDGDDWVQRHEFKRLLANLFYFNKIFWVFDMVDNDKDRRLTFDEFKQVLMMCGTGMSEAQARGEFQKVDRNGGGIILFDEFCKYYTQSQCPQAMSDLVDDQTSSWGRR